jgi:hypothetical protein
MSKNDALGFQKGLENAAKTGYLGNSTLVSSLVRSFAQDVLQASSPEQCYAAVNKIAEVFSGVTEGYALMPEWHNRMNLGAKACARLGIDSDQSFQDIMRSAFADYAVQLRNVLNDNAERPQDQWDFQIDAIIEHATALMLGTIDIAFPLNPDA